MVAHTVIDDVTSVIALYKLIPLFWLCLIYFTCTTESRCWLYTSLRSEPIAI